MRFICIFGHLWKSGPKHFTVQFIFILQCWDCIRPLHKYGGRVHTPITSYPCASAQSRHNLSSEISRTTWAYPPQREWAGEGPWHCSLLTVQQNWAHERYSACWILPEDVLCSAESSEICACNDSMSSIEDGSTWHPLCCGDAVKR